MLDKVKNNYSDDLLRLVKMMLSLNKLERSSFGFYSKQIDQILTKKQFDFNDFIINVNDPKLEPIVNKEQGNICNRQQIKCRCNLTVNKSDPAIESKSIILNLININNNSPSKNSRINKIPSHFRNHKHTKKEVSIEIRMSNLSTKQSLSSNSSNSQTIFLKSQLVITAMKMQSMIMIVSISMNIIRYSINSNNRSQWQINRTQINRK